MSIYKFKAKDINGQEVSLETYKGKVIMIVNTASKCGFTPQFEDLQKLYETYKDKGFVILGFPSNQFKNQDPGSREEIKSFCTLNYGVEFPMFDKIDVNGDDAHPLFNYLKEAAPFQGFDMSDSNNKILDALIKDNFPEFSVGNNIRWNFTKFLINKDGEAVERFESSVLPMDIEEKIKKLL
ncbi:glutathione peroxidase [Natranaerovirga hydrolytica]|uniref:Glutathione peroxidase n=1 Tax=Natranaerovirga hydrolytica TaxID=680378 RepID=A0A4R1MRI1_9FIRM|nr:glutathione peroxidase [Natranaerovirga hydrolytica]TCK93179.1 glutathione peroxidase [Natranaerovirga hydrolytica]